MSFRGLYNIIKLMWSQEMFGYYVSVWKIRVFLVAVVVQISAITDALPRSSCATSVCHWEMERLEKMAWHARLKIIFSTIIFKCTVWRMTPIIMVDLWNGEWLSIVLSSSQSEAPVFRIAHFGECHCHYVFLHLLHTTCSIFHSDLLEDRTRLD